MNKRYFSIRWKFTILSILIILAVSSILVVAINYDIKNSMPELKNSIMLEITSNDFNSGEEFHIDANFNDESMSQSVDKIIGHTVDKIYYASIAAFFIIVIFGASTAYLAVGKILKPIVELNDNIKKVNENNLMSTIKIRGSNDEITDLTISFNHMISKLDNSFASLKRFNSNVAHELKSPLAVIKTNIDVFNSSNDKSVEECEETLKIIEKSIMRMNTIVETLLDMVRQENAPLNDIVSLGEILYDVTEDLELAANSKEVCIRLEIDNDVNYDVRGNEILLYRSFYNVVENAVKYNKIKGFVDISCAVDGKYIKIEVSDTGKGIDANDIENIFRPFYRCDGININSSNGIGLGLALTESAIKLHEGKIKAESTLDVGTKFIFMLPMYEKE